MNDPMCALGINIRTLRDRLPNLNKCLERQNEHTKSLNKTTPEREMELQEAMLIKMGICRNYATSLLDGFSIMVVQDMADTTGERRLAPAKIALMNEILVELIAMCTLTHDEWDEKIADARKASDADPDPCIWSEIFGCAIGPVIRGLIKGTCTLARAIALLEEVATSFKPGKRAVGTGAVLGGAMGGGLAAAAGGVSLATVGGGVLIGAAVGILAVCVVYTAYGFCKGCAAAYSYCISTDSERMASEYATMLERINKELPNMDLDKVHNQLTALMGRM